MKTERIQEALRESRLDGWLFFDHHRRDPLAYRVLGIPDEVGASRRWYYFVPAHGQPRKLVHRIESGALDSLPGSKESYSSWAEQHNKLRSLLSGCSRIAMQYSPNCAIPYVSLVDAGTVELVRSLGVDVVSSADLIQEFEARWTEEQFNSHLEAGRRVDQIRREAFEFIGERLRAKDRVREYDVQQFVRRRFEETGMTTDHGPIVAVNGNASDPHYEPSRERTAHIQPGDFVLIDLWAKLAKPDAVYYDITWTGFCGDTVPDRIQNIFDIVRDARKRASAFVVQKISSGEQIFGFQVDDAARGYIEEQGYADSISSIGQVTASERTCMGLERTWIISNRMMSGASFPDTCFSIEPGIYLPEFGVRSEVNVYVGKGFARVTGEEQEALGPHLIDNTMH